MSELVTEVDPNGLVATAPEGPIRDRYIKFVYTGEPDVEVKYREAMFVGDFGVGKTRALLDAMLISALNYPGAQLALLRDTGMNLKVSTLPIVTRVFDSAFKAGILKMKTDHIEVYNGSVIWLFGLDVPQALNKLKTAEFLRIFVDQAETVSEERWDLALLRTRQKVKHKDHDVYGPHYVKGAANWDTGENWIMRRFRQNAARLRHGIFETRVEPKKDLSQDKRRVRAKVAYRLLLEGTADENHSLSEDYFEAVLLAEESGTADRFFSGGWTKGEGLVFPQFNYSTHAVDSIELPGGHPIYVGLDWGVFHPSVAIFSMLDDAGVAAVYDEYSVTDTSATDFAWAVARMVMQAYNAGHTDFTFALDRSMKKRERDLGSVWEDMERVFRESLPDKIRWRMVTGSADIDYRASQILKRIRPQPPKLVVSRTRARGTTQMMSTIRWEDVNKDVVPLTDFFDALGYAISIMPTKKPLTRKQILKRMHENKRRNSFLPRRSV